MRTSLLPLLTLSLLVSAPAAAQKRDHSFPQRGRTSAEGKLDDHYRKWLDEDVTYIITKDERKEFLSLRSDEQRDKFMQAFWEARNPTPGSEINTVKEEHYRRLAYVNEHFGDARYNDGWRTDMGRVYITLGPPKQRAPYHMGISTREMELWFYQSPSPALPPYFNVLFYKPGYGEEYKIYSPREDGPQKLVTDDSHTDEAALKTLEQSNGAEVRHAAVTLLPSEPVSDKDPAPSMNSDILLAEIRDLPDQKLEKERLARLRAPKEVVTASLLTGDQPEMDTALLRDDKGEYTVHVLLKKERPDDTLIGTLPDKRTGYNMTLRTRVSSEAGQALYETTDTFVSAVTPEAAKMARERLFAAEARVPLPPGKYVIETTLTNRLNLQASRVSKPISVPARSEALGISNLVAYTQPSPVKDAAGQLPFSVAGLRFTPRGSETVLLHQGERLPLLFQLWVPLDGSGAAGAVKETPVAQAKSTAGAHGAEPRAVKLHYVVGSVAGSMAQPVEEDETVALDNLDSAGNMVTGHTVDTSLLPIGVYRVVVKATEPGLARSASAAITVKVLPKAADIALWTAYGAEAEHPAWREALLRGVAAEKSGQAALAEAEYRRAVALGPDQAEAQQRLDAFLKTRKVAAK